MKAALVKRLEHLENRQDATVRLEDRRSSGLARIHLAMGVNFVLTIGRNAREALAEADASIDPDRRARLEQQVEAARSIAALLAKHSNGRPTACGVQ